MRFILLDFCFIRADKLDRSNSSLVRNLHPIKISASGHSVTVWGVVR